MVLRPEGLHRRRRPAGHRHLRLPGHDRRRGRPEHRGLHAHLGPDGAAEGLRRQVDAQHQHSLALELREGEGRGRVRALPAEAVVPQRVPRGQHVRRRHDRRPEGGGRGGQVGRALRGRERLQLPERLPVPAAAALRPLRRGPHAGRERRQHRRRLPGGREHPRGGVPQVEGLLPQRHDRLHEQGRCCGERVGRQGRHARHLPQRSGGRGPHRGAAPRRRGGRRLIAKALEPRRRHARHAPRAPRDR
mmetsp:Transcript_99387/g.222776  ORF Transcript_99387/g.222776 Transcript_99387/m.222776 type:complete len:247 (+) Transcript_99387:549-1289(+)